MKDLFTIYDKVDPPRSFGNVDKYKLPELKDAMINYTQPTEVVYNQSQPSDSSEFDWLEMQDIIDPPFSLQYPQADGQEPEVEEDNKDNTEQPSYQEQRTLTKADSALIRIDIEDLLRSEGITSINGKKIKFGRKTLRPANASYGAKNSNHKKRDPHTGNAMARDISIIGGTQADYAEFRRVLLNNPRVRAYMAAKGWGIINEITPSILKRTRGTGPHFHFGPDTWANRTWKGWLNNPSVPITKAL